jgi:hypothetical protein
VGISLQTCLAQWRRIITLHWSWACHKLKSMSSTLQRAHPKDLRASIQTSYGHSPPCQTLSASKNVTPTYLTGQPTSHPADSRPPPQIRTECALWVGTEFVLPYSLDLALSAMLHPPLTTPLPGISKCARILSEDTILPIDPPSLTTPLAKVQTLSFAKR